LKSYDLIYLQDYNPKFILFGKKKDESEISLDLSEFDKKEIEEINRVKQMLEASEKIKVVARQSRIMPGGSIVTPDIIFATTKRLIKRNPSSLGLRSHVDSIPYSQINKVHLEKGVFTSELVMDVGQYQNGDNRQVINAIPKKKAEVILSTINEYVRKSQDIDRIHKTETVTKTEVIKDEDPLVTLKKRLAKGEITAEEYVALKKVLEE